MNPSSPEIAYKFLCKHFASFPGVEEALKKALLMPGGTPEFISTVMQEFAIGQGVEFTDDVRRFAVKALEHMQFLAQVEAGTYCDDFDELAAQQAYEEMGEI